MFSAEIIIIGAGAAGLAAAHSMADSWLSVVVLEARDRIGGRISSIRPFGTRAVLEGGAEFVHGQSESLWQVIRSISVTTDEVGAQHWTAEDGHFQQLSFGALWDSIFSRLQRYHG